MNDNCPLFEPLGQNVLVTMDQQPIQSERYGSADYAGSGKVSILLCLYIMIT